MNSIGTSNISALVSKADTQECHSIIYEDSVPESEFDNYPFNDRVSELLVESDVQYQVILQTSKALAFCRSTKEFSAGDEELEAERILLLASKFNFQQFSIYQCITVSYFMQHVNVTLSVLRSAD